ncbi:MAG: extensin family protein [Bosea sp. (in: a-proteobacteria)]
MRKGGVAFLGLALVALFVGSCGRGQREQRAAWRDEAEAACLAKGEVRTSSYVSLRGSPIQGPGTCGMEKPLRVNAFAGGQVGVTSAQTLSCPIVATTDRFLEKVVQPAAMGVLGTQVIEMKAGSYSCRSMNNGSGTSRRSEHAFGNALDIFSFRTSDGREITVRHGWNGSPQEQDFLREVFVGACEHYKTVLGPGADMFHYDHFHVDLARHNGGRAICRPIIKFTPRRDLPPPDPARGWTALNSERQAPFQPLAAQATARPLAPAAPATGGPIRLPGSGYASEEVVIGDVEGEMIDPESDPFAAEAPTGPTLRAAPAAAPTTVPVQPGQQSYRWTPGPAPAPPPAQPARAWPPKF